MKLYLVAILTVFLLSLGALSQPAARPGPYVKLGHTLTDSTAWWAISTTDSSGSELANDQLIDCLQKVVDDHCVDSQLYHCDYHVDSVITVWQGGCNHNLRGAKVLCHRGRKACQGELSIYILKPYALWPLLRYSTLAAIIQQFKQEHEVLQAEFKGSGAYYLELVYRDPER